MELWGINNKAFFTILIISIVKNALACCQWGLAISIGTGFYGDWAENSIIVLKENNKIIVVGY